MTINEMEYLAELLAQFEQALMAERVAKSRQQLYRDKIVAAIDADSAERLFAAVMKRDQP